VVGSVDGSINGGYLLGDPRDVLLVPNDPNGLTEDTGINLAFDIGELAPGAETSCTFAMVFGGSAAAVDAQFAAIDFDVLPSDQDIYSLVLESGREVTLETMTPGELRGDRPDLLLQVLAADGSLLVGDDNSAADGRNAQLTFLPEASGTHYVRVSAVNRGEEFDAGSYTLVATAGVPPVADSLTVTAAAVTPSGFTIDFSEAVDPASLRLWAFDQADTATMTLSGESSGPVSGSVVLRPDATGAVFIATGGILPDDRYTIRLGGDENGVTASGGGLLDGDGDGVPGGDFITSEFITGVADTVVVSLPDQVRGPGQAIMSTDGRDGLPLLISTGIGASSLDVTLRYDPDLLVVEGFSLDPALSFAGVVAVENRGQPGRITLSIFTTSSLASTAGTLELGRFLGFVPATAPLGTTQSLELLDLVVFDASVAVAERPSLADQAIHAIGFVGDASGNGRIQANDAVLVARLAAGLETVSPTGKVGKKKNNDDRQER